MTWRWIAVELVTSAIVLFLAWLWGRWYDQCSRREYIRVMHPFLYDQLFNDGKNEEKLR